MEESTQNARCLSIEEFLRSELLNNYNLLVDEALLLISNRNIHLKSIHTEFLAFSRFIMRPLNKDQFFVFLTPVFQHLYLLLISHKGKSDADKFANYYRHHLPFPSNAIEDLLECETSEDVENLIRLARIRVKLSSNALTILMNWLKDSFSRTSQMFHILRVLHENFHLDIYQDKDYLDFGSIETRILHTRREFLAYYLAIRDEKKSGTEITTTHSKSDEDNVIAQKLSQLVISSEASNLPESSDMPKTSNNLESHKMRQTVGSSKSFELKSSMLKMRDSARIYLEKVRKDAKEQNWSDQQIEKAVLNIPKPDEAMPTGQDNQGLNIHRETTSAQDENDGHDDLDTMIDSPSIMDKNIVTGIIKRLADEDNAGGLSPFDSAANASSTESEYMIWSDSSTERVEEDPEVQEIAQGSTVQHLNETNEEEDTEVEDNDEAPNDDTVKDDEKNEEELIFKVPYKTNFYTAYPITISGKDVLCSTDVSSDLSYLACAFQSLKICTWRINELVNDLSAKLELLPIGTLRGHKAIVYALSIDTNEKCLISGSHDGTVRLWDIEESTCTQLYETHSAPVYTVCASPISRCFLSAAADRKIVLTWYDPVYPIRTYAGHSHETTNCVKFHPNGVYFASASSDGDLFLFKVNDNTRPVRMFCKHTAEVYTLAFSPSGKHLASADVEGKLIIWDILTYAPIKILETGQGIRSISFDAKGSFIAAVFYFKSWKIYNIAEDSKVLDVVAEAESVGVPNFIHFTQENVMFVIQYVEAEKREITETACKPKTIITTKFAKGNEDSETAVTTETALAN